MQQAQWRNQLNPAILVLCLLAAAVQFGSKAEDAQAAEPLSEEWMLSMRLSDENVTAFAYSGWGRWQESWKVGFAISEMKEFVGELAADRNLYTCDLAAAAGASLYEMLRTRTPELLAAAKVERQGFLSTIAKEKGEDRCVLGEMVVVFLLFLDLPPQDKVPMLPILLQHVDLLIEVPPEIVVLSGWLPSLSAALGAGVDQCNSQSFEGVDKKEHLDYACKRIYMLDGDMKRVVNEARCNARSQGATHQHRTASGFVRKGDGLAVSATRPGSSGGDEGDPLAVVYNLCAERQGGEFPAALLGDGLVARFVAASVRWRDPLIFLGPCSDVAAGALALELLVYVHSEDKDPWLWGVMEQLNDSTHARDALHCKHLHYPLAEQPLTCVWPGGSERPAIAGPIGHWGAVVQCAVPVDEEASLAELGRRRGGGLAVNLRIGSVLSPPLQLCAEDPGPRRRLVACSKPLWNASELEVAQPYLMQDWVHYHAELGVEHFQIYDLDDSFDETLAPLEGEGLVTRVPRFAKRFGPRLDRASTELTPFCLEPHTQDHCAWSWRGRADWVVFVESPDVYLWSSVLGPSRKLTELLDEAWEAGNGSATLAMAKDREHFAGALVRQVHFGGRPRDGARGLLDRFTMREREAYHVGGWEYPLVHPWNFGLMNVINFTGRNDGRLMFRFHPATLRADHYVDLFRPRCDDCTLRDESKHPLLERVLARRLSAAEGEDPAGGAGGGSPVT